MRGAELTCSHSRAKWGVNRQCKSSSFALVFGGVSMHTGLKRRRECDFGDPRGTDNRWRKIGEKLKGFEGLRCSEGFSFEV